MSISDSPDIFLEDLGVPVVWGEVSGKGLFESPDEVVSGVSLSAEYRVLVNAATFDGVADGDDITVDGSAYVVRGPPEKVDDGAFMWVELSKE